MADGRTGVAKLEHVYSGTIGEMSARIHIEYTEEKRVFVLTIDAN